MSRPEIPVDWEQVERLMEAGCMGTEVAAYFGMHPETFYGRVEKKYKLGFTEFMSIKRQKGDSILKAVQFKKAAKGDNTMLVWLGKTRLKQREVDSSTEMPPQDVLIDKENEIMSLRAQCAQLMGKIEKLTESFDNKS